MASSVEVRSPFLDYRVVEYARTLPVIYRIKGNKKKYILREILKEYVPQEIFDQPKKGFSCPIGEWIRNELKKEFEENLSDDFLNKVPNLDIPKFKIMFQEHLKGECDYSSYIWRVYVLSKWYQEFNFI
jgi:asparagine synthase (glutamine-hydrolysing)